MRRSSGTFLQARSRKAALRSGGRSRASPKSCLADCSRSAMKYPATVNAGVGVNLRNHPRNSISSTTGLYSLLPRSDGGS